MQILLLDAPGLQTQLFQLFGHIRAAADIHVLAEEVFCDERDERLHPAHVPRPLRTRSAEGGMKEKVFVSLGERFEFLFPEQIFLVADAENEIHASRFSFPQPMHQSGREGGQALGGLAGGNSMPSSLRRAS